MGHIANKIDAKDIKLQNVFYGNRYKIDVFQREYRWQREQIEALISDLCSSFLNNYNEDDTIESAINYDCYYMGPIVLCEDENTLSIVDGQQRLTSFTLLLIHLHHLQNQLDIKDDEKQELDNYIFVKKAGKKTLVLNVEARKNIITELYQNEKNVYSNSDENTDSFDYLQNIIEESIENIKNRYDDIIRFFPPELKEKNILPIFIEWLLNRVVLVEIKAFNLENAYTIFETMNDRGLSLNPTEILKAYLLSNIKDETKAIEANEKWKELINELKIHIGQDSDLEFFRNWLRAKYAITKRGTSKGSENEDFEKIGVQFHAWVKNNHKILNLKKDTDFYYFILADLDFYIKEYLKLYTLKNEIVYEYEDFYITNSFAIADSLVYPLLLAPVKKIDDIDSILIKYTLTNRFIDIFTNIRMLCNRPITQSSIRNYFYDLIKEVRNKDLTELSTILEKEIDKLRELKLFAHHFYVDNGGYYHYMFARILSNLPKVREEFNFNELLRNRKQNSFVLVKIFRYDELEQLDQDLNITHLENTIANYCLIRRYDMDEFNNKPTRYKISFLGQNNYVPEIENLDLKTLDIFHFIDYRNSALKAIISNIWI